MSCESHFQYLAGSPLKDSSVNGSMSQQAPKSNIIHRRSKKDIEEEKDNNDDDHDDDDHDDDDHDDDDHGDALLNACVVIHNMFHFYTVNGVICIETCINKWSQWCGQNE
jgi:hypothetical protein